ncbi:TraB/GumN family protein [Roseateles sp. UC29_93]|uniref:TraB/GumN family protein n=1 Tax=Roseateles sp. UC29_93 TaxID=3350177 RepID=UPI00366A5E5D
MWTLKRDGRTSYLYASLHVGKPGWAAPGPRLRKALDEVDAVALELDPLDRDAWKMPPMPELPLDAAMRQRLDAQAVAVCLEPHALAAMHPLLQTSTYMLLRARSLGLDVRYGQEMLLSQWARDRGLPVLALETLQGQLEALLPADVDAARHELRSNLQQLERPKSLLRTLDTMVGVYDRGDLARLNRYAEWCDCVTDAADRAALQRINDGRNPALAQRISELHQRGQSLLVAVGAMHMTGPPRAHRAAQGAGFRGNPDAAIRIAVTELRHTGPRRPGRAFPPVFPTPLSTDLSTDFFLWSRASWTTCRPSSNPCSWCR